MFERKLEIAGEKPKTSAEEMIQIKEWGKRQMADLGAHARSIVLIELMLKAGDNPFISEINRRIEEGVEELN